MDSEESSSSSSVVEVEGSSSEEEERPFAWTSSDEENFEGSLGPSSSNSSRLSSDDSSPFSFPSETDSPMEPLEKPSLAVVEEEESPVEQQVKVTEKTQKALIEEDNSSDEEEEEEEPSVTPTVTVITSSEVPRRIEAETSVGAESEWDKDAVDRCYMIEEEMVDQLASKVNRVKTVDLVKVLARQVWGSADENALEIVKKDKKEREKLQTNNVEKLQSYIRPFSTQRQRKRKIVDLGTTHTAEKKKLKYFDSRSLHVSYRSTPEEDLELAECLGGWGALSKLRSQVTMMDRDLLEQLVIEQCAIQPELIQKVTDKCLQTTSRRVSLGVTSSSLP